ncbi:MAG TPA: pantetheine-phosphate adenylyltransferase [Anaerolineaceae bacterium]|nr:pantetheine-phosphate adenylyltransferase [Anaerolineaceae bacterium]HOV05852.1 pantetheine-phosphate adenylyltransferase [Anaerolineaceae bacterium]
MIRAVFPGSFDPVHNGHVDIARRAAKLVDELIVAVYDKPLKTFLFTPEERIAMVRQVFAEDSKITVTGYSGITVNFCRQVGAQVMIRGLRVFSDFEYEFRMALANHRLEPEIEVMALITSEEHTFLSSTTVREIASLGGDVTTMVPELVKKALDLKFSQPGYTFLVPPTQNTRD